ncbi:hypothetical protein ACKXGF_09270 [Alkalibacillus sp. S2W]|uniref:hypothetical protein n=1 Tax=Alkalibacillus TaxID=331654 RepID=UPI00142473C5|nr:hypothetical protein [Alkalibacillus almallahensis]NIK13350.1 hypothetical protein [Alkalibacillus almallahensis]
MGGLIELIASNIFIIFAILAGLFSIFQKGDNEEKTRDRPVFKEQNRQTSTSSEETVSDIKESVQQTAQEKMDDLSNQTSSWYEAMEDSRQRLEEVENQPASSGVHGDAIGSMDTIKRGSISQSDQSSIPRVSVHENITRKRIVESFMMAEVLSKPKSKANKT